MQIIGPVLGCGIASSESGRSVPFTIRQADHDIANVKLIGHTAHAWHTLAEGFTKLASKGELDPDLARRAGFADEVIALSGSQLSKGLTTWLYAQADADDELLGLASYAIRGELGVINLVAVSPAHLAGLPTEPLRGVGTALVAVIAELFVKAGVTEVRLHPLDSAAHEFWTGRGFLPCPDQHNLCIRGAPAVSGLIDGCRVVGVDGVVQCGLRQRTAIYQPPARAVA